MMVRDPAASCEPERLIGARSGKDILRADRAHAFVGTASASCPIAVRSASGCWVEDHDGKRYLDLYGNNCHHIGYGHPRLLAALHAQLDVLTFTARGLANAPAVAFEDRLLRLLGWPDARVVSTRSGADAVEIALSVARASTGRHKTISFEDAYHGRSAGALSVGGRPADRAGLGPLLPGAQHAPPWYPTGAMASADPEGCARTSLAAVKSLLQREGDVGAVVGETVRNNPHTPPDWFWPEVRALCDASGALLILDEIATGLGKTGAMFNFERPGVRPDLVILGKALGGAMMPAAAVVADRRLEAPAHLNIGYFTHEKNPLCAVAGDVTLAILEEEALPARAAELGRVLDARLRDLATRREGIARVRSAGLMAALDFAGDAGQAADSAACSHAFARERGVLLMPPRGGTLSLSAPLVISEGEMLDAIDVVDAAVAAVGQA